MCVVGFTSNVSLFLFETQSSNCLHQISATSKNLASVPLSLLVEWMYRWMKDLQVSIHFVVLLLAQHVIYNLDIHIMK